MSMKVSRTKGKLATKIKNVTMETGGVGEVN